MALQTLPSRPRILSQIAHKYLGRPVSVIGEVTSITPHANTLTLRMADDESIIVLLQKNSTTIEPNLLTEVCGKLVSKGQIESSYVRQWGPRESANFNKSLYVEAVHIYEAHRNHYDV